MLLISTGSQLLVLAGRIGLGSGVADALRWGPRQQKGVGFEVSQAARTAKSQVNIGVL